MEIPRFSRLHELTVKDEGLKIIIETRVLGQGEEIYWWVSVMERQFGARSGKEVVKRLTDLGFDWQLILNRGEETGGITAEAPVATAEVV